MWSNEQVVSLLSRKKHPWVHAFILSLYQTISFATTLVALALFYLCLGIKLRTLWDLIILKPFLITDNTILFTISIVTIASAILGLISAILNSQRGLLTSMGLTVTVFCIMNIYTIAFRVKDFISELDLYYLLKYRMYNNPIDNFPIHIMQKSLSCCGIHHYYEWKELYNIIPGSCCKNGSICDINETTLFKVGCFDVITKILQEAYEGSIEIIITLDVFFIIILFSAYFYYFVMEKTKQNKNTTFTVLPRILVPNNPNKQEHAHNRQTQRTLDNHRVQEGNNTVQNNSSNVHNSARPTNENIEPIYPYLSMPEPNI